MAAKKKIAKKIVKKIAKKTAVKKVVKKQVVRSTTSAAQRVGEEVSVAPAMVTASEMVGAGKDVLYRVVASGSKTSIVQAKANVNAVLGAIVSILLAQGKGAMPKLSLSEFGTFSAKRVPTRQGRNPQTGKTITCPPTARIMFKASSVVKDKIVTALWAGKSRAVPIATPEAKTVHISMPKAPVHKAKG